MESYFFSIHLFYRSQFKHGEVTAYPFRWRLAYSFPDSDGVDSAGALCQCPCSGDHTFPGGAGPGGSETGTVGDCGLRGIDCGMDVTGASCQCPCSEDHRSEERRVGKECRSRWSPYH